MAVLSLPTTFSNSFWTQDYRKGLEVLYGQLEQSVGENTEIAAFIRVRAANVLRYDRANQGVQTRAAAELAIAAQLNAPPPARTSWCCRGPYARLTRSLHRFCV